MVFVLYNMNYAFLIGAQISPIIESILLMEIRNQPCILY